MHVKREIVHAYTCLSILSSMKSVKWSKEDNRGNKEKQIYISLMFTCDTMNQTHFNTRGNRATDSLYSKIMCEQDISALFK